MSIFSDGGATQALIGAALGSGGMGGAWFANRSSREKRAQELFDRIMEGVRQENADLRDEVEACRERDKRAQTVEVVVRITLAELQSIEPNNPTLRTAAHLLRALPPPEHNPDEWKDLLEAVSAAIPDYVAPEING